MRDEREIDRGDKQIERDRDMGMERKRGMCIPIFKLKYEIKSHERIFMF